MGHACNVQPTAFARGELPLRSACPTQCRLRKAPMHPHATATEAMRELKTLFACPARQTRGAGRAYLTNALETQRLFRSRVGGLNVCASLATRDPTDMRVHLALEEPTRRDMATYLARTAQKEISAQLGLLRRW